MNIVLRKLELAWQGTAVVLLSGAFLQVWRRMTVGEVDLYQGDPVGRFLLGVAYLGVILLVFHSRKAIAVGRRGTLLWVLLGWVLISALWSTAPATTLRRGAAAMLAALYGLLLAVRYSPRMVLRVLGMALGIIIIGSLASILLSPQWGVMGPPHPGAWRGVFTHKNTLGRLSVLALIVYWTLFRQERRHRVVWALLGLAGTVTLIGSRSATSLAMALLLPPCWIAIQIMTRLQRAYRLAIAPFMVALILVLSIMLPSQLESILGFFGRDLTLTGRIPLWRTLIPIALERPLLGYGYGAFWLGERSPLAAVWARSWNPPHAHNGYLDLWLELGLVGAVLSVLLLVLTVFRSAAWVFRENGSEISTFAFLYSVFFGLANATESVFLESGLNKAIYWVLLTYIYLMSRNMSVKRMHLQGTIKKVA